MIPTKAETPPPDGEELISRRYAAVLAKLKAQDEAISAMFAHLEGWSVHLDSVKASQDELREEVARISGELAGIDDAPPAEKRLDDLAAAIFEHGQALDSLMTILDALARKIGVPGIEDGDTLEAWAERVVKAAP
jgi:hypothetical protein